MEFDKNIAHLFLLNFNEAYRSAKLLLMSYERIAHLIPIQAEFLKKCTPDELDKLDAFRVRYCDLQDTLGNKIFRSLVKLEEEPASSNLDILNKMEKRGILPSFEIWKRLREIRNLFSQDYPDSEEEKAEILNIAYSTTLELVVTIDRIINYIEKRFDFNLLKFPVLLKDKESL